MDKDSLRNSRTEWEEEFRKELRSLLSVGSPVHAYLTMLEDRRLGFQAMVARSDLSDAKVLASAMKLQGMMDGLNLAIELFLEAASPIEENEDG